MNTASAVILGLVAATVVACVGAGGEPAPERTLTPAPVTTLAETAPPPAPAVEALAPATPPPSTLTATPIRIVTAAVTDTPTAPDTLTAEPATERDEPFRDLFHAQVEGVLVTVPGYARIELPDLSRVLTPEVAAVLLDRIGIAYPGRTPASLQLIVMLTRDLGTYVVIGLDTDVDKWLTTQQVDGFLVDPISDLLPNVDWKGGLILSDSIELAEPERVSPRDVLDDPTLYALRRVEMDTTYAFGSVRLKESTVIEHVGFALATDDLGSADIDGYLAVIDPYNTETQIRDAAVFGTVLYASEPMLQLLTDVLGIDRGDVDEVLSRTKPALFFEDLIDDEAELVSIERLVPTLEDPTPKLADWHGQTVSIEGIALGETVRTEDIQVLENSPVHITGRVEGVVDLTGAMPLVGLSSKSGEESGVSVGHYRYQLAIHAFGGDVAFAFVLGREPVPLDPVEHVERAEFGDRVSAVLHGYAVVVLPETTLASDFTLAETTLLVPTNVGDPPILTHHPELTTGDYLAEVQVDGYMIGAAFLGVPEQYIAAHGAGVVVAGQVGLEFEKGVAPLLPTVAPVPTVPPAPTAIPLPPTPTAVPVPSTT